MRSKYFAIFSLFITSFLVVPIQSAFAATSFQKMMYNPNRTYKDEKVEITNSSSRCLTVKTKAEFVKSVTQAKKDGEKFSVATSTATTHGLAYREYLNDLNLAWDAMNEPYCGFGQFGVSAALKSYKKSVERSRTRFIEAMKKTAQPVDLAEKTEEDLLIAMAEE